MISKHVQVSSSSQAAFILSRCSLDAPLTASITGIGEKLIHLFSIIVRPLYRGYAINSNVSQPCIQDTAIKFVSMHPWCYLGQTLSSLRGILTREARIIKNVILPVGMLLEESLQFRNKRI